MLKQGSQHTAAVAVAVVMFALAAAGCRKNVALLPPPPPPPPPSMAGAAPEPEPRPPVGTSDVQTAPETAPPPSPAPAPVRIRGTIQGSVLDPAGGAIAGAVVTAIGNGTESSATTSANGQFVLRNLEPGTYRIEITTPGFKRTRIENVAVVPGQSMNLNPVLELGLVESLAVTASGSDPRPERPAVIERLIVRVAEIPPSGSGTSGVSAAYNRLPVGAYRFELPDLRQQEKSVVRLLIDANPIKVSTEEEWQRAVAQPGSLAGRPTKISDLMMATLSASGGVAVLPLNQSPDGQESVFAGRLTKWNWEVTPSSPGTQVITVDLRAKIGTRFERVDPFPIVEQKTVLPSAVTTSVPSGTPAGSASTGNPTSGRGLPWLWLLVLLAVVAIGGVAAYMLWKRRAMRAVPIPAAGALNIPRLLVIHGMHERQQAEKFCERIGVKHCEYIYSLSGFPAGSPKWQQEFRQALAQADAVIVLLTGVALGEEWVNWQVEQAVRQQSGRGTPIYPVVMDEQVSRAASTLGRLSAFAWLDGGRKQDLEELKERVAAIQPAPTRLVKCFLSYSRKIQQEIDMAVRLEADLEQMGYRCFRDLTDLRGGDEWERVLREQLADTTHLLVLVTPTSIASRWVLKEILWAEGKKIIPLMTQGVTELPEELRRYQGIAFSNYETGLFELLQALQKYQPARASGAA